MKPDVSFLRFYFLGAVTRSRQIETLTLAVDIAAFFLQE